MKKIVCLINWTKYFLPMHPIVYISTVSKQGIDNAAVFATCFDSSYNPPQITFASAAKQHHLTDDGLSNTTTQIQDTLRNIRETGLFIVNVPGFEIADAMNELAYPYEHGIDEIEKAGLTKLTPFILGEELIHPKLIGECLAHLECRLTLDGICHPYQSDHFLITGEVVGASHDECLGNSLEKIRPNLISRVFGQLGASAKPNTRLIGRIIVEELPNALIFEAERK
jgi:flavin reductase (DIM6/NTAB) family NADH-FMN oxidoreductase RutF